MEEVGRDSAYSTAPGAHTGPKIIVAIFSVVSYFLNCRCWDADNISCNVARSSYFILYIKINRAENCIA